MKTINDQEVAEKDESLSESLPWEEIQNLISGDYLKTHSSIKPSLFKFAAKKGNRDAVVKAALKTLQDTDPKNATQEKAESLADMMQIFARMVLGEIKKEKAV